MDVYPKDSFKRFGDDLSEILLSYLSFEDKFRYECVSKQFKRVVFNKQTKLISNNSIIRHERDNQMTASFGSILTKCPNIKSIDLIDFNKSFGVLTRRQFYRLIEENLKSLNQITYSFEPEINDQILKQFLSKVGPKIEDILFDCIDLKREPSVRSILKLCPNLNRFRFSSFDLVPNFGHIFEDNQILLTKLKSFQMKYSSEDIQRLEIFVENNKNSLKSLEIFIEEQNPIKPFKHLLELKELKRLKIRYDLPLNHSFVQFFADLTTNLTEIEIRLKFINCSEFQQIYKSINRFENLKSLKIDSSISILERNAIETIIREPPNKCKNLMHLIIVGELVIGKKFFDSFDKYFPKLRTINCENTDVNEKILNCLMKLNLKVIRLYSLRGCREDIDIIKSIVGDFIQKSPKLEFIVLKITGKWLRFDRRYDSLKGKTTLRVMSQLFVKESYYS